MRCLRNRIALTLAACTAATWITAQTPAAGLAGDWEGALDGGGARLRLVLHVRKSDDGLYTGKLDSVDQGSEIPIGKVSLNGRSVRLEFPLVNGTFSGELAADGSHLTGMWSQGTELPLTLKRIATPPLPESAKPAAPGPRSLDAPLDVELRTAPIAFVGAGGRTNLVYELHITNFSSTEQNLTRIEVLVDGATVTALEGTELMEALMRPGARDVPDARKIGPGLRAVAFLWVPILDGKTPGKLAHKITANQTTVEPEAVVLPAEKPIVIGAPLRGGDWVAVNGPGPKSVHRRALIPLGGRATIAQRFAIDWVQLREDGKTFHDDPKDNRNYRAYGAELLAVANATVTATKDGIPENVPGVDSRAVPITKETIAGNHVILDFGGGRYAMYAHLQPGSVRVKPGDRVQRGQVLGLLGNSGNSTEPHLHFQVMNGPSPLMSEGLPYGIDAFEVQRGQNPGKRQKVLPMQNMVVRFTQ